MSGTIRVERDRGTHIATISIDAPGRRNAFSRTMVRDFCAGLRDLETDDDIKVIVIRSGTGDLSVGSDMTELDRLYASDGGKVPSQRARLAVHHELWWGPDGLYTRLLNCRKITVARAAGRCFGVGFYLCLYSDMVVASDDAAFSQPRWRHVGVDGDISMLVAAVGLKRASELMYCDARWSAADALRHGLIDNVVASEELDEACADLARACATIMRDGIATEKQVVFAALAKMQIGLGFAASAVLGGWASNIHHRAGEFNVMRELRDHGVSEAIARSEKYYGTGHEPGRDD